jgi:hypothetical protein
VREEFQRVNNLLSFFHPSLDAYSKKCTVSTFQVLGCKFMTWVVRKSGVIYPCNLGVGFQVLCYRQSILGVLLYPERKRLKALKKQECIEG